MGTAMRQVEVAEVGIGFAVVGNWRHDAGLERLHSDNILDARTHRVTREALRVRDHDTVGRCPEDPAKRIDLGGCRATASRRIGLVGHEHRLVGDCSAGDATRFSLRDDRFHHRADVLDVETGAVECGVGRDSTEHFTDRLEAALASRRGRLHHEGGGAHADDHAVPPSVERRRCVFDVLVGRGGTAREKAARDPRLQRVAGGVVGRHHDHPRATPGPDPVLGERDRLRRRSARGVNLRVRAPRADDFGELGVPHRQHAEQKPAIEVVRIGLDLRAEFTDHTVDLAGRRFAPVEPCPKSFEREQVLAT